MLVQLSTSSIASEASQLSTAARKINQATSSLASSLNGCSGMAGIDPMGEEFAQGTPEQGGYDASVAAMLRGGNTLAKAVGTFESYVLGLAAAYRAMELAGADGGANSYSGMTGTVIAASPGFVGSALGDEQRGTPQGEIMEFIENFLKDTAGIVVPTAETSKVTTAASAWETFSTQLTTASSTLSAALPTTIASDFPQSSAVSAVRDKLAELVDDLATDASSLAQGCRDFATNVETIRGELRAMLGQLALEVAIDIGVGIALSFLSFGAGALAGIAKAGVTIGRWIPKLVSLVNRLRSLVQMSKRMMALMRRAAIEAIQATVSGTIANAGASIAFGTFSWSGLGGAALSSGIGGVVSGPFSHIGSTMTARGPRLLVTSGVGAVTGAGGGVAGEFVASHVTGQEFNLLVSALVGTAGGTAGGGLGNIKTPAGGAGGVPHTGTNLPNTTHTSVSAGGASSGSGSGSAGSGGAGSGSAGSGSGAPSGGASAGGSGGAGSGGAGSSGATAGGAAAAGGATAGGSGGGAPAGGGGGSSNSAPPAAGGAGTGAHAPATVTIGDGRVDLPGALDIDTPAAGGPATGGAASSTGGAAHTGGVGGPDGIGHAGLGDGKIDLPSTLGPAAPGSGGGLDGSGPPRHPDDVGSTAHDGGRADDGPGDAARADEGGRGGDDLADGPNGADDVGQGVDDPAAAEPLAPREDAAPGSPAERIEFGDQAGTSDLGGTSRDRVYSMMDGHDHVATFAPEQLPPSRITDSLLQSHGVSRAQFTDLINRPLSSLTPAERMTVNGVRDSLTTQITADTVFQKVMDQPHFQAHPDGRVTMELGQAERMVLDDNARVTGSVSIASDTAPLASPRHFFTSLRLDYPNTNFRVDDPSAFVVRFQAGNGAITPQLHSTMGGSGAVDHYAPPFTGNGFLAAADDILPEYRADRVTMRDGAEVWEVLDDGTQRLFAVLRGQQWIPQGN